MGVMLQGFYKPRPNRAVPSPTDGDPETPWWWDQLAAQANELRTAGVHRDLAAAGTKDLGRRPSRVGRPWPIR